MATVITVPFVCKGCGRTVDSYSVSFEAQEYVNESTLYNICCRRCGEEFDQFWISREGELDDRENERDTEQI